MNKSLIIILLLIIGVFIYSEYFKPGDQPEVTIKAETRMDSSLANNVLTEPNYVLSVTLNTKKYYSNLSFNVNSDGLIFQPQSFKYFTLNKKRVFEFTISAKDEYKKGSIVEYSVSVIDNNKPNSIVTKDFEYEVGKVNLVDMIKSYFWAIMLLFLLVIILTLAYILDKKKFGEIVDLVKMLISIR